MTLKENKDVYIALYSFPEEGSKFHLEFFDNADAAILCIQKARENGSGWTFVDKREVKKKLSDNSGLPDEEN